MRRLLIPLILTTACTSTPKKETLEPIADYSQNYKRSVSSTTVQDVPTGYCSNDHQRIKRTYDWKLAVEAANLCMKAKDYAKVEDIGNLLAVREPSGPWGPFFLAQVAKERGDLERALWMSELALKRAVNVGLLHYLKGQILFEKGDIAGSVVSFKKSTQLDNSLTSAHILLGQIYFRDQDFDSSAKHFQEVVKKERFHQAALTGLAESYLQLKNPRAALDAYGRLASHYSSDGQYLRRIAEIYEANSNPSQALGYYRELDEAQGRGKIKMNFDRDVKTKIKSLAGTQEPKRSIASEGGKKETGKQK